MSDALLEAVSESLDIPTADEAAQVAGWLSTGNYALNWALSNRFVSRGWPLGHTGEIYGLEGTGKTFLGVRAMAEAQAAGGAALIDDAEGRYNAEWARRLGVDTSRNPVRNSETVEEHYEFMAAVLDAYDASGEDRPLVLFLDSIGILTTTHEAETAFGVRDMTKAYELRKLFRRLKGRVMHRPVLYLAANHVYSKIGASPWEKGEVSSGGGGFKYQASVRVSMRTTKKVKGDGREDDLRGIRIRAVIEKNSATIPYREASVMIPFDRPIDPCSGLVPRLIALGYLDTTKGHNLVWEEEDTGIPAHKSDKTGLKQDESARELLERYPDLLEKVDAGLSEREQV